MAASQYDAGQPRPVEDVLTELDGLLDELAGSVAEPHASPDVAAIRLVDVSARLRVTGARVDAVRWSVLPRIESAGLWAQTGARSFPVWLARAEEVQTVTAKRDARTARALRDHLPATLTAALAGKISIDKVRALVDVATTSTLRTDALGAPAIDSATTGPSSTGPSSTSEPTAADPTTIGGTLEGAAEAGSEPVPTDGTAGQPDEQSPVDGSGAVSPTWEEQLLDWSAKNGPGRFRGLVRYFARHADPDADERGYTKAKEREYLDVSTTLGGYHLSGFLTEEHGQVLTTAISSVMGAPAQDDSRTPGQRRAQGLADLARTVLDNAHTGTGASVRPHLSVTVSWTELRAMATKNRAPGRGTPATFQTNLSTAFPTAGPTGPTGPKTGGRQFVEGTGPVGSNGTVDIPSVKRPAVFTETSTPVPTSLLRRIACDSSVTRIVFGPDAQVLNVGRAQRTITGQLRRAVIARDKHCVLGQCDQPPSRCEVHHAVRHWADGGETSVTNAALLCYHHHDLVDSLDIAMHYDNGWRFTDRNGLPAYTI